MRNIILIVYNLRSCHNVGAILRTCDGLGVDKVYLTGYTPYPKTVNDERLPHIASKVNDQIAKTALGAEKSVNWQHFNEIEPLLSKLTAENFKLIALEQAPNATKLTNFKPPEKLALIVGREVEGLEPEIQKLTDKIVEIPMLGSKESFNVATAAAIALYHCRYFKI